MDKRIIIGSDHGGVVLKKVVNDYLKQEGYIVTDVGTEGTDSCDYPDYAFKVSEAISRGEYSRGIVICTSGIGVSMCANKSKNVRAALCISPEQAVLSRKHNDANVLALGEKFVSPRNAIAICEAWLTTPFEGGRHARRVNKIIDFENGIT